MENGENALTVANVPVDVTTLGFVEPEAEYAGVVLIGTGIGNAIATVFVVE